MGRVPAKSRYGLQSLIWLGVSVLLGSQPVISATGTSVVPGLDRFLDVAPHQSPVFLISITAVALLGCLVIYTKNLNPFVAVRSRWWVYVNLLSFSLILGVDLANWEVLTRGEFGLVSYAAAPAVGLLLPLIWIQVESVVERATRKMGLGASERGWRPTALRLLRCALRLRPGDPHTTRLCGRLYAAEDEFGPAAAMFKLLGPIAQWRDMESLRALDHSLRALGNRKQAVKCLLRLRDLKPKEFMIDRRILDDYVALGKEAKALELLETDRITETFETLKLRQRLNVRLGNLAQAVELVRLISVDEGPPYNEAVKLYKELLEQHPDHLEVMINLGMLLIEDEAEMRRREGAQLLEEVIQHDPRRLRVCRKLAEYYQENDQMTSARDHLRRLVEAGDPNPEYYLTCAQQWAADDNLNRVANTLRRMTEVIPGDWRGHYRFARALYQLERMEKATQEIHAAVELAPDPEDASLTHLRGEIERGRHEQVLERVVPELEQTPEDVEKRAELIDALIALGDVGQIIDQCGLLLETDPSRFSVVEQKLMEAIDGIGENFRLRDYLGDLLFEQARYEDLLRLTREMSGKALDPDAVVVEMCRKILARAPEHLDTRRALAAAFHKKQDWHGVIDAWGSRPDAEDSPLAVEDKALWVEAAYRLGDIEEAAPLGLRLAEDLVQDVPFMLMLIEILQKLGDHEQVWEIYSQVLAANPGDGRLTELEPRLRKNRMLYRVDILDERQREDKLTAAEHFEKAELHTELGQLGQAIAHYQRASDEDSLANVALAKMAINLCDRGMFEMADEILEPIMLTRQIAEQHPELMEFHYIVARLMEKLKRTEQAKKYYKRLFRVDASFQDVVERIERLS